jgi:hypothetical protein
VPNYAQRTGKRLFFQPGFFTSGASPMFATAARKYPVFFHFPWSENDDVEIALPKGFDLDNAELPPPVADPSKIGNLEIAIRIDKTANVMKYDRKFYFGKGGNTLFSVASYPAVKGLFDAFNKSDTQSITLKQQ